jgi:hypothetical protein
MQVRPLDGCGAQILMEALRVPTFPFSFTQRAVGEVMYGRAVIYVAASPSDPVYVGGVARCSYH